MKNNSYNYDAITNTLTITKAFAKQASQLNTLEYKTLLQLRHDNPNMKIVMQEGTKNQNGSGITFKQMEAFIGQCRDSKSRLDTYKRVKALSQVQRSPYKYVKDWFMTNYANYSAQPEFDEDGFVIVKTKAQLEQEAKDAAANSNVSGGTDTENDVSTKADNEVKDANESGNIITTFVDEDSEERRGGTISVAA